MMYVVIGIVTLVVSGLTLFAGFGVSTMLVPVFAIFFAMPVAIALTAVVHLLNNVFKVILLGKRAHWKTVLIFGLPAIVAAFAGAWLMTTLAEMPVIARYELGGAEKQITPIKLTIGVLIGVFALFELVPRLAKVTFGRRWLPLGGVLSGFFGGLSGHQGALRGAFLIKSGLDKTQYIATAAVVSTMVDLTRLFVYTERFLGGRLKQNAWLLVVAVAAAFVGTFVASRFIEKVTLRFVQTVVGVLLFGMSVLLITGVV